MRREGEQAHPGQTSNESSADKMSVSSGAVQPTPPASPPRTASPERAMMASGVAVFTLC